MANFKSTQRTNEDAVPQVWAGPNESGKVRRKYFDYTTPSAGAPGVGDTIELVKIQKGARLQGGIIKTEAFSSGAGTAGLSIGDGTTAAKYASALNVDAIAAVTFGDTIALYFGESVSADFTLTATVTGEALAASKGLRGYVEFLIDG